ncbi:MAG: hypothetical protein GY847_37910 [Proteobacteria bacterium]|nr:hypothetical protein [Pseudomonadota bacterium]
MGSLLAPPNNTDDAREDMENSDIDLTKVGLQNNDADRKNASAVMASLFLKQYNNKLNYGYPEKHSFGELSVKFHRESGALVMLSNHAVYDVSKIQKIFNVIEGAEPGEEVIDIDNFDELFALGIV